MGTMLGLLIILVAISVLILRGRSGGSDDSADGPQGRELAVETTVAIATTAPTTVPAPAETVAQPATSAAVSIPPATLPHRTAPPATVPPTTAWRSSYSYSSSVSPAPVNAWMVQLFSRSKAEFSLAEVEAERDDLAYTNPNVRIYDSDLIPYAKTGYWVIGLDSFSSREAAIATCDEFGLERGPCYPRHTGTGER